MAKNTNVVEVTVTAGNKVTLNDIKALRALGVTATGKRSLEVVTERAALVGITVVPVLTDNAKKMLEEGKALGLLRNAPKAKATTTKGGKAKAAPKGKVEYTKADGSVVTVTAKQAAAWDAFKANRKTPTVTQSPKGTDKAKVSTDQEQLIAAVTAAVLKAMALQG